MLNSSGFRKYAHQLADWMADYLESVENYPVKSMVAPGDISKRIPDDPPENGEKAKEILDDVEKVILPGMTHWQSPHFHAYFPANTSYPSILAEMITAALGAQCMMWDTSPAATELEKKVMNWLKKMTGLPETFEGVIQDTASTSSLVAILSAREKCTDHAINRKGFAGKETLRIYCSTETHSSIEKDVKIAGIGSENLIRLPADEKMRLDPGLLETAIENDLREGNKPFCVVATIGTTGTLSVDPLADIARICKKYNLWLHVDAAYSGTALILPEYRWMAKGVDHADSFVFNPHKWMFTNFDCSAYFVKDRSALIRTFEILPEYLKTGSGPQVNNYRDWGIQLGRRFRALKLWFVIRDYGVNGIREKLREHIKLADWLAEKIENDPDFFLFKPRHLNMVCFRYEPAELTQPEEINKKNRLLLQRLNASGKLYLSHTKVKDRYMLRLVTGQTRVEMEHVEGAWNMIRNAASQL